VYSSRSDAGGGAGTLGCRNGRACSDPVGEKYEKEVGKFADCEQGAAEEQSERSAEVTQQSQLGVGHLSLDQRILQLREKYLHNHRTQTVTTDYCRALYVSK